MAVSGICISSGSHHKLYYATGGTLSSIINQGLYGSRLRNYSHTWNINNSVCISYLLSITSETTMLTPTFNPFSLLRDFEYRRTRLTIQEIIDYAESRFTSILTHLCHDNANRDIGWQKWVTSLLAREVVRYLGYF